MFVKNPNLGADPNLGDFTVCHDRPINKKSPPKKGSVPLSVRWYVCKSTIYIWATHNRKNNSYVIINGCLSFYLNCCTLSFPINMFMFWQFRP